MVRALHHPPVGLTTPLEAGSIPKASSIQKQENAQEEQIR
jgi:hypothetical protein